MTQMEGGPKLFATGPVPDDLAVPTALAEQAHRLGQQHRDTGITPFGDAHHVCWDEGSARVLSALGVTSPTTRDNVPERQWIVNAYCGALEPPDTGDVEPGW